MFLEKNPFSSIAIPKALIAVQKCTLLYRSKRELYLIQIGELTVVMGKNKSIAKVWIREMIEENSLNEEGEGRKATEQNGVY